MQLISVNAGSSVFPHEQLRLQQGFTCGNHASNHAHDNKFETFSCSLNNQIYGLEGPWWEGDLGSKRTIIGIKFVARSKSIVSLLEFLTYNLKIISRYLFILLFRSN